MLPLLLLPLLPLLQWWLLANIVLNVPYAAGSAAAAAGCCAAATGAPRRRQPSDCSELTMLLLLLLLLFMPLSLPAPLPLPLHPPPPPPPLMLLLLLALSRLTHRAYVGPRVRSTASSSCDMPSAQSQIPHTNLHLQKMAARPKSCTIHVHS